MTGLRPVVEVMYIDFGALAMDQIVNQAAKARYMFGGKARVPLVMRTQGGGGRGNAAQHSQSLEMWYVHTPGLIVVQPSTPYDAKGLLKSAIRNDNPVIFIEHKLLYNTTGPVPDDEYLIPLGLADIKRPGKDVTIVATSRMVLFALEAAEKLAADGIEAEVIDPRTLKPLDLPAIVKSVEKTGRLVAVNEGALTGGFTAEVAARVATRGVRLARRADHAGGGRGRAAAVQRTAGAGSDPQRGGHRQSSERSAVLGPRAPRQVDPMAVDIIMPRLGLTMEEGTIVRWHAAEGDRVAQGQVLLEVETDKVTVEVEAPATGVMAAPLVCEGQKAPVGALIGRLLEPNEILLRVEDDTRDDNKEAKEQNHAAGPADRRAGGDRSGGGRFEPVSRSRHRRGCSGLHPPELRQREQPGSFHRRGRANGRGSEGSTGAPCAAAGRAAA